MAKQSVSLLEQAAEGGGISSQVSMWRLQAKRVLGMNLGLPGAVLREMIMPPVIFDQRASSRLIMGASFGFVDSILHHS
jgi:hypothetical protein